MRKWNLTQIRPVNVLVQGKAQSKIALTTFWLTVFVGVAGVPILVVYFFQGGLPFLRQISIVRWAETILQFNSLFNPLLYWYRNRRLREATLELLRCRHRPAARTARHIRQRRSSVASLDVKKLKNGERGARLLRSESVGAMMSLSTSRSRRNEAVKERPMSVPSREASDQGNKLLVTVQIEKASEGKSIQQNTELPKNTTELERSQCYIGGKILRSSSLNKNSVASITKCHPNVTQWSAQRSRSEPIILTNALIKQREEQLLMSLPTRKTFVDSL